MMSWPRFCVVYGLFLLAAAYMGFHRETPAPLANPLSAFPAELGPWRTVHQEYFSQALISVLRPSDYLSRRYQGADGNVVDLYIGYHDGGQGSGPIHSPRNCLPGSGWYEVFTRPLVFTQGGESIHLTQALYRQGERRELFVYWFMVKRSILADEVSLKLAEIANSVRNGQRGASFVRISLPSGDKPEKALAVLEGFLRQAFPTIRSFISS